MNWVPALMVLAEVRTHRKLFSYIISILKTLKSVNTVLNIFLSNVNVLVMKNPACKKSHRGASQGFCDCLDLDSYSSILPWRITRTEEPGRLLSMGSQRVRHD